MKTLLVICMLLAISNVFLVIFYLDTDLRYHKVLLDNMELEFQQDSNAQLKVVSYEVGK